MSSKPPMPQQTVSTLARSSEELFDQRSASYLALSVQCYAPLAAPVRVALRDVAEVTIGRGSRQEVAREGTSVRLRLPDSRMSTSHARLFPREGAWFIEDQGSKNGLSVNGTECLEPRLLRDRDVIEIGHSFFVFREQQATDEEFTDLTEWESGIPAAFRTLSPALAEKFESLRQIAASDRPVLIRGETGTGKEVISRAVHEESGRDGRFVAVNCGALPETLVEAELFGHRRGAFSGATDARDGFVRVAHEGTLLLDEIAELSPSSQVALLRVLQESEVVPVGSTDPVDVDVRFIAATHQDVTARIDDGRFRRDLYTRLTGFQMTLPALRDRIEDLGLLIASILRGGDGGASETTFRPSAVRQLFAYDWPGNIRELDNVIGAALVLARDGVVSAKHLAEELRADAPTALSARNSEALRSQLIELHRKHHGNVSAVAREIGKARQQVHRWNRRLRIDPSLYRDRE